MKNGNKNNSLRFQDLRTSGLPASRTGRQIRKSFPLIFILFLSVFLVGKATAQSNSLSVKGFLEYNNTSWAPPNHQSWSEISGIYNRLDFSWIPSDHFNFHLGMRNNFNFGSMMSRFYPIYSNYLTEDNGFMDLTFKLAGDSSYVLYSNLDRLNFKLSFNKLEITVGRQRINWGINTVWNPNDIFNTYNYFDFDYVERPGSDAVLAQYYTGALSSLQIAAKLNYKNQLTAAAMYKFNVANYDIQFLSGVMDKDFVAGLGWAGQIKGAGFTGEASYFRNMDAFSDTTGQWVISVSGNYTFKNSLFVNASVIYNSKGSTGPVGVNNFLQLANLSPKTLTLSRLNWFAEASYPVTPLIKLDVSSIMNPYDNSAFLGPSVDFSMTENLELFVMGQVFLGKQATEYGGFGQMFYMRLKWSF